ncbi:MAG TPA: cytochrome c [Terrimicrobiaceae bacterium]|nr:cytochrome c [Terrimicrobiaceae bacterium]
MIEKPTIQRTHEERDLVEQHQELLDEGAASRQGAEMLPAWLIVGFLALAFLGAGYLFWNSGGFSAKVFNPARVAWDGAGTGGASAAPDPMVIGKRVFIQNCAVCHQQNGEGVAGQFPPLVGSEWVLAQDWHGDNHIVKIVLHGFHGPVTVKGQQFNNVMAPWGKVLKDEQIAAVLTYVRNEWGNKAPPITKEFVSKIREQTKDRTEPWTQKELQATDRVLVGDGAAPAPAPAGAAPAAPGTPAAPAAPTPAATPGA